MTARYELGTVPPARRALAERLPFEVASAAVEFITDPSWTIHGGSASRLARSWPGYTAPASAAAGRALYEIDDAKHAVIVLDIRHRLSAYRHR